MYPQDGQAGGTWLALKENMDALCLLNAVPEGSLAKNDYSSRGTLLLKLARHSNIIAAAQHMALYAYKPFCLIVIQQKKLWQVHWNGMQKEITRLDETKPFIWSSTTLYDSVAIQKRQCWFNEWLALQANKIIDIREITAFHFNAGEGNEATNLVMTRPEGYSTVSITAGQVQNNQGSLHYHDLINKKTTRNFLTAASPTTAI